MDTINLTQKSSLPISFNGSDLILCDLEFAEINKVHLEEMRSQLLNPEITSPNHFYSKYVQVDTNNMLKSQGLRYNIYQLSRGLGGIEYIKTRAYKMLDYAKIMEVLTGAGWALLQKYEGGVKDIITIRLTDFTKFIVPANYDMVLVNTKPAPLIVGELYCSEARHINTLDEMQGMSYYFIKRHSRRNTIRNPIYLDIIKDRKIKWDKALATHNLTARTPIIKQVLRKYEKFKWLFEKDSVQKL